MGYKMMTVEILQDIFRRWHCSQIISNIAGNAELDRKTVGKYILKFKSAGYCPACSLPDEDVLRAYFLSLLPVIRKKSPISDSLLTHKAEIIDLITDPKEPVKIKTAWKIITRKYHLKCSYELFKKFVSKQDLKKNSVKTTIRIELPPGKEIQVDYGKVGTVFDSVSGKNKAVQAFCGILSHSRLPYIEFCLKQDQTGFVKSHVKMFNFYGGTPDFITLDNLKAGVIKPDLYDPKLNRAYNEMAVHYGLFINPCRVASPKDKGKIERFVQPAREVFRMLRKIHPTFTLPELNKEAKKWCLEEYGAAEHGTTGIPPLRAFNDQEKQALKPLPEEVFSAPVWKKAKVHADQFFSFDKNRYSLPAKYRGKDVWLKNDDPMLYIYHEYNLIRTYIITGRKVTFQESDFPEVIREMMNGGFPKYLLDQARLLGEPAFRLIESILESHAYINSRRAQGVLEILKKNRDLDNFDEVCNEALVKGIKLPKKLKALFNDEREQLYFDFEAETSEEGKEMVRDADYYIN